MDRCLPRAQARACARRASRSVCVLRCGADGLADELVGSRFDRARDQLVALFARQHDDGNSADLLVLVATQRANELDSVHARHVDVGNDEIHRAFVRKRQPLLAALGIEEHEVASHQEDPNDAPMRGAVIDYEHGVCHGSRTFRSGLWSVARRRPIGY